MKTCLPSLSCLLLAGIGLSAAEPLRYSVSWLGNSFSGASNRWVQNFLIHTQVQPDGTVNTWSHWDEGGKKFGVYKDGDVVGNQDVKANSLEVKDKAGRTWKIAFDYVEAKFHEYDFKPKGITCDGDTVKFPGLFEPTDEWNTPKLGFWQPDRRWDK